jgi:4-hydroxy-tetrahydrodipicolinate synthase
MTVALAGVWPAVATALTPDEDVDDAAMRRIVRFLVDSGVDGLWLLGGNGEGVLLSDANRRRVVEAACEEAGGAVPVFVGVSGEGTMRVLERFRAIADLPIDGVFATPPFYYGCSQLEIAGFYEALAAEIPKPVVAYNNNYVTSTTIELDTVVELADKKAIAGLKDTSGDLVYHQALVTASKPLGQFPVLQGFDNLAAASLLAGATGVVSAVASFAPSLVVSLMDAARRRDAEGAFAAQEDVVELISSLGWDPYSDSAFIRGAKVCLEAMGLCEANVARPFTPADESERRRTREVLSGVARLAPLVV